MSVTFYNKGNVVRTIASRFASFTEERLGIARAQITSAPIPESVKRLREALDA